MYGNFLQTTPTMNELTKAWECVPRSGIPNNLPASTLLTIKQKREISHTEIYFDQIVNGKQLEYEVQMILQSLKNDTKHVLCHSMADQLDFFNLKAQSNIIG